MKLSFSLPSSKTSSARPPRREPAATSDQAAAAAPSSARSEFVTVFDPNVTLTAVDVPSVAPLPNTNSWRATKRMKNLLPPPSDDPNDSSTSTDVVNRFELDTSQPITASSDSYGLTLRSKNGGDEGQKAEDPGRGTGDLLEKQKYREEQKYKEDIGRMPEDRGMEEFQDISVEDFGKAVLAGYGWKEGQGIGRNPKVDVKVREYKKWTDNGGLGFKPDKEMGNNWKRCRDDLPPIPSWSSSSRRNDTDSTNGESNEVVRIIAGKHAGSKAEVLRQSSKVKGLLVLSLEGSGLEVRVREDMIADLGSAEEESYLKKLKEVEFQGERKSERRRDNVMGSNRKDSKGSHRMEDGKSSISDTKPGSSERKHSVSYVNEGQASWLRRHIRVRIVSKSFMGGKLYLKKGEVMDVVGPKICDLSMDESGEILQGVDQDILETALPKCGGPVLVLYGRYKGRFGHLMEKDSEKETAVVHDADGHELIKVRLEQIAEYIGDPSDLGY